MKNNRLRVTEAAAVNEVGLQDLLDLSQKVQTSVLGLQNAALKFNDRHLMGLATKLASDGGDFHKYISQLVMDAGGQQGIATKEKTTLDAPEENIDDNSSMQRLESAKTKYLKRKKLKEAEESEEEEEEVENTDEKEEGENTKTDVVIDLSEPFEKVIDGLDDNEFDTFKSDVVAKLENHIDTIEDKFETPTADEYAKTVEALGASDSSEDFDFALDKLYDFADKHDIIVETVKKK